MFKIYDLNMKELPFPEGVKPLDIFVSSVNKRRVTEEFEGRSGTLNYGYDYGERSVDLSLWLEAHDTIDYRLIRNELYAFFDTHDVFYIEETRVPSRVLKVTIDESYIPERINQTHSSVEISCRTLDSVFWESKYTTLELHDSGYSATSEKYGLVDNIDDEKVKYRFTSNNFTVYNAGNVTVEPESMQLNIVALAVQSTDNFTIRNTTTGEEIVLKRESVGGHLRIQGMVISLGSITNIFRDTNQRFISLAPGDNQFEILNGTFEEIRFEFKFLYK